MKTHQLLFLVGICITATAVCHAQVVTWSAEPDPTGYCYSHPDKVKLGDEVTFGVQDLEDLDTKTTIVDFCTPTEELVADDVDGYWWIMQPGADLLTVYDVAANIYAVAWNWDPESGETDAVREIDGLFTFDDGRDGTDARHDSMLLCASTSLKLIPDDITTTLGPPFITPEGSHLGHDFHMALSNTTYPGFSFGGLGIREQIMDVSCDVKRDEDLINSIKNEATGTWSITADNNFDRDDRHAAGMNIARLFAPPNNNSFVTLLQVYRITTGGWPAKNPNHAIGAQGGFLGGLAALHTIVFENVSATFVRVTKDGITCSCTP